MKPFLLMLLLAPTLIFADTVKTLASKNATLRDDKGRISATCSAHGNSTAFRDAQGRIVGSAYQSSGGCILPFVIPQAASPELRAPVGFNNVS